MRWFYYTVYKLKRFLIFVFKLLVMGLYYKFKKEEPKYRPPYE